MSPATGNKNTSSNLLKSFVQSPDITPTILELADVSHPSTYNGRPVHALMGKSIKALLDGSIQSLHPTEESISRKMFNHTSVRMGDGKLQPMVSHRDGSCLI